MKHYLEVKGGDEILIDLGGFGLEIKLDKAKKHYDIEYVGIEDYGKGRMDVYNIPADVIGWRDHHSTIFGKATKIRIKRH